FCLRLVILYIGYTLNCHLIAGIGISALHSRILGWFIVSAAALVLSASN
ncbi:hypothetical protein TGAM01_v209583, partial [Trichoderma gamsii]